MSQPFQFDRMMTAGFDAWRLSFQVAETLIASQAVIGARMAMLGHGLDGSGKLPVAEFSRLIPEKTAAFGKANAAATRAMIRRGGPQPLTGAFLHDATAMFDLWERSVSAATAWWLPLHAQATANAERLTPDRRR